MEKSFIKLTLDITDEQAINTFKKLWLNSLYGKNVQPAVTVDKNSEWIYLHLNTKIEQLPLMAIRKSAITAIKQDENNRAIIITNHSEYFCEESYSDMIGLITHKRFT